MPRPAAQRFPIVQKVVVPVRVKAAALCCAGDGRPPGNLSRFRPGSSWARNLNCRNRIWSGERSETYSLRPDLMSHANDFRVGDRTSQKSNYEARSNVEC